MSAVHLLSVTELEAGEVARLVDAALAHALSDWKPEPRLAGCTIGIAFSRPSTRTRTAFTVAAQRLGASTLHYGPGDLQLTTGETPGDTARVLSGYLDGLVVRTRSNAELLDLTRQKRMAVVNALTDEEHPTQSIADLAAIQECFGELAGLHVLFLGEGGNIGASLAQAVARTPGMKMTLATPEGYGLDAERLAAADALARPHGGAIEQVHDLDALREGVDVVYTTRWRSMGEEKSDPAWRSRFEPFRVTEELLERVARDGDSIFLHDLPAERGAEVVDAVLDGPRSRAFRQAQHKLSGALAVLEHCLGIGGA